MEVDEVGSVESLSLHFSLEGAWFADMARDLLREGAWERALAMLTDSLQGITHEQAVAILRGRATLSGWSSKDGGIEYEELPDTHELAQEMDHVHDYLYGSCFRWRDDYWKPYAVVAGLGEPDMEFARTGRARTLRSSGFPDRERWRYAALRSLFYANSVDSDLVVYVPFPSADSGTVVLCERTKMPPTWVRAATEAPERHLQALLEAGRTWQMRGALELQSSVGKRGKQAPSRALTPAQAVQSPKEVSAEFLARLEVVQTLEELSFLRAQFDRRFEEASHWDDTDPIVGAEKAAEAKRLELCRKAISAQADAEGGWMELKVTDREGDPIPGQAATLRVPRNPFLLWCLNGYDFENHGKERPSWQPVCPRGMKMYGDDPHHTDWMVGAGLDPESAYEADPASYAARVQASAYLLRTRIYSEWCQADFVILARGKQDRLYGEVVFPKPGEAVPPGSIVVIPHAGPEYQATLVSACKADQSGRAGAVICEVGGRLAHLAVVGREFGHTLLLLQNAMRRLKPGTLVTLDLIERKLHWQ